MTDLAAAGDTVTRPPLRTRVEPVPVDPALEAHRRELTGYCYRMLGGAFDAEDAVQETLMRAWRARDRFEGRSSVRSWLYRIATNVCFDMLNGRQRRARPMELGPASPATATLGPALEQAAWVEPMPDGRVLPAPGDPADVAVSHESIRLAFVAALQHLPPRQRAVLILCEVLRWKASEAADLLDTTVASVNSALQRARATLASSGGIDDVGGDAIDAEQEALVARYADAFERYDMDALVALLSEDVQMSMPPFALWLQGPAEVRGWMLGQGSGCRGSRLVPTRANGLPAFGQYRADPAGGHMPWGLVLLEVSGDRVAGITTFLDTANLFPLFGLPLHLDDEDVAQS